MRRKDYAIIEALITILKALKPQPLGYFSEEIIDAQKKYIDSTIKLLEEAEDKNA